jgi:uncharacterized protein YdhG (YjbR/CyaY superfamily)
MKKITANDIPQTVDAYLIGCPEGVQEVLQRLRETIRKAAPKAEELISYQIPTYKLNGALVHFACFEKHCSFFVVNKGILTEFASELKDYKTSGTTIHFTAEKPLPVALVKKIVKVRVIQNLERKPKPKKASFR